MYLAPAERARFTSGRMVNLISTDTETVQMLCQNLLALFSTVVRVGGALVLLYNLLGVSSLVALAVLIVLVPMQVSWVARTP